jgi:hypothetical protein
MRHSGQWLTFRGELYHFERLAGSNAGRVPLWAVMCRGEFIGTMIWHERENEHRFATRAMRWLEDLYGEALRADATTSSIR